MSENNDKKEQIINVKHLIAILAICIAAALLLTPFLFNIQTAESDDHSTPAPTPTVTTPPYHNTPNQIGCTSSGKSKFALQGNYVYYIDGSTVYRQSIDSSESAVMFNQTNPDNLNILGNSLFYSSDQGIHKVDIYTLSQEIICPLVPDKMIVRNDGIFFTVGSALMYCSKFGENTQLVYDKIEDFTSCGEDIIVSVMNQTYGCDLWCMGTNAPFATEVVVYTVRDNIVCAETSQGTFLYDGKDDYSATALPISFELIPSSLMLTDSGIVYMPRNGNTINLINLTTGYERTIIDHADELYCINNYIIYKKDGILYSCLDNGWQKQLLANGLPAIPSPSTLDCSNITISVSSDRLSVGQSTLVNVQIDSMPVTEQQLSMLAFYIKDNTVISFTRNNNGTMVITALERGQSVLRISGRESNVFAEVLIIVE